MRFWRHNRPKRVLTLGLDCASPDLVFEQFKDALPTLSALMRGGQWGTLRSSIPCITVPAWASMLSSRDPGVLGVYGFRNRAAYDYGDFAVADSRAIHEKRVWDYLGAEDKQSVLIGVPQTYPVQPINGHLVSCFLTPNTGSAFAYPAIFKQEVLQHAPHYLFDVAGFRTADKANLLQRIYDLTAVQYQLVETLITQKPWDFFMHVNIGVDRMHHGFWRYHDPQHRLHEADSPFRHAIRDYYQFVDAQLARIIEKADDATIIIVSDHGAKRMDGAICINEWLWQNGWLVIKNPPPEGVIRPFSELEIDWERTRAWSVGGYYARIFLNIAGREPCGIIAPQAVPAVIAELKAQLACIPDHKGDILPVASYEPVQIYQQVNGHPPDLIVYLGDLHWRAVGGIGYGRHYTFENDTGPDDANHAEEGLYILYEPQAKALGQGPEYQLMDIAPTILQRLGQKIPPLLQGSVIL